MTSSSAATKIWDGATTRVVPPADYWPRLARAASWPGPLVRAARELSDQRVGEIEASSLPPPKNTAVALLDQVAADGWFDKETRRRCPACETALDEAQATLPVCPHCDEAYAERGGVATTRVYVRSLAPTRDVDWVVAIHGMNTTGAWQEAFSWHLATTWGRSVPVAVYKYGIVVAGVIMAWRRRALQADLRDKLAALRDEARAQGFEGRPDVIAHSFGTWLLGHILQAEISRPAGDRLTFGRLILTGCILRPDFDWKRLKDEGLVEDVLNHYGTSDLVVPWAHFTIVDSGPSGRRGFDGDQVVNVRAEGFGHSDLFSIEKPAATTSITSSRADSVSGRQLHSSYHRYWRPFLTLPREELRTLPDCRNPRDPWRPLPWPLRGTFFPWLALPLVASCLVVLLTALGRASTPTLALALAVATCSGTALGGLVAAIVVTLAARRLWAPRVRTRSG